MTEILIVGSGGREHALGWKLGMSRSVSRVYFAPGNGGTRENVPIGVNEFAKLIDFAKTHDCLTIVGPEDPLSKGIVNVFEQTGLKIFGPTREASVLESSKAWSKRFMKRHSIPTAWFEVFDDPEKAKDFALKKGFPIVVKADGLAAGKGVFVCKCQEEAFSAIERVMAKKEFGNAGNKIILEEFLSGEEASFIAITDGDAVIPLATSQDHKRLCDDDCGPNTGGMGAYSPAPIITDELFEGVTRDIMQKTVDGMRKEGMTFKGFLYAGLMIRDGRPYVLEFNARLGDPEAQPLLARMESDLFPYIEASVENRMESMDYMKWDERSAVCVVMASGGYPGSYEKGKVISGLEEAGRMQDVVVFHAGTRMENGGVVTNGGRVLGVTALGQGIKGAIERAYSAAGKISWEGVHYRKDIGRKALKA